MVHDRIGIMVAVEDSNLYARQRCNSYKDWSARNGNSTLSRVQDLARKKWKLNESGIVNRIQQMYSQGMCKMKFCQVQDFLMQEVECASESGMIKRKQQYVQIRIRLFHAKCIVFHWQLLGAQLKRHWMSAFGAGDDFGEVGVIQDWITSKLFI